MGGSGSGKPKGELLRLDGLALVDGKIEKTDFFNFLKADLSDYSDVYLTAEQALAFKNSVIRLTYGTTAAIPMLCSGERCLNKTCPLHLEKNYIYGRPCLIEARLIQNLTQSYIEDLGVDPNHISEMTLVNKLVECDIIDCRGNFVLSGANDEEAITLTKSTITESDNGVHKEEVKIHPILEAKEKYSNLKLKILDSFAATRREKYKKAAALKQSEETDASKQMAELRKLYSSTTKSLSEAKEKSIIDADWSSGDL